MKNFEITDLLNALREFPDLPNVFNQWAHYDPVWDASPEAPHIRLSQFERYINARIGRARIILCAEAVGCYGGKFSGIAMTDERVLSGNKESAPFTSSEIIPGVWSRTSKVGEGVPLKGMNEMTTSVLYSFLYENDIDPYDVVTWNAFPFHPHTPGNRLSNRTPDIAEIEAANHLHDMFFGLFRGCQMVAVGNHAKQLFADMGYEGGAVRHPANGGANQFREQLGQILGTKSRQETLFC